MFFKVALGALLLWGAVFAGSSYLGVTTMPVIVVGAICLGIGTMVGTWRIIQRADVPSPALVDEGAWELAQAGDEASPYRERFTRTVSRVRLLPSPLGVATWGWVLNAIFGVVVLPITLTVVVIWPLFLLLIVPCYLVALANAIAAFRLLRYGATAGPTVRGVAWLDIVCNAVLLAVCIGDAITDNQTSGAAFVPAPFAILAIVRAGAVLKGMQTLVLLNAFDRGDL
jgi:hypothetical protein